MLSQQEAIDSLKATSESLKRQNRLLQELIAKQAEELAAAKKRTRRFEMKYQTASAFTSVVVIRDLLESLSVAANEDMDSLPAILAKKEHKFDDTMHLNFNTVYQRLEQLFPLQPLMAKKMCASAYQKHTEARIRRERAYRWYLLTSNFWMKQLLHAVGVHCLHSGALPEDFDSGLDELSRPIPFEPIDDVPDTRSKSTGSSHSSDVSEAQLGSPSPTPFKCAYLKDLLGDRRPIRLQSRMQLQLLRCHPCQVDVGNKSDGKTIRMSECRSLSEHLIFICVMADEMEHVYASTCNFAHHQSTVLNPILHTLYLQREFWKTAIAFDSDPRLCIASGPPQEEAHASNPFSAGSSSTLNYLVPTSEELNKEHSSYTALNASADDPTSNTASIFPIASAPNAFAETLHMDTGESISTVFEATSTNASANLKRFTQARDFSALHKKVVKVDGTVPVPADQAKWNAYYFAFLATIGRLGNVSTKEMEDDLH